MKFLQVEQDTDDWLNLRRTKIGASDAPVIMNCGYKKPSQLMQDKLMGKESYVTSAMQRGKELEPLARDLISKKHNTTYRPVVVQSMTVDWQMASLDGFDDKSGYFIEIKCPNAEKYAQIARGEVPIEYFWQIQHQLCVTDQRQASLFAFDGQNLVETVIQKDERAITELLEKEYEFHRKMVNFEIPTDELQERNDKEFIEAMQEFLDVEKVYHQMKELREIKREAVIYQCQDRPCRALGVTVRPIFTKGKVDYSKVPQLEGVDLEPYRSDGYMSWRFQLPKESDEDFST